LTSSWRRPSTYSLTDDNQILNQEASSSKRIPFPEELYQIIQQTQIELPEELINNFSGTADGYYYFAFANAEGEILIQSDNTPTELNFLPIPTDMKMSTKPFAIAAIIAKAHTALNSVCAASLGTTSTSSWKKSIVLAGRSAPVTAPFGSSAYSEAGG
jgi:hypothetical protein